MSTAAEPIPGDARAAAPARGRSRPGPGGRRHHAVHARRRHRRGRLGQDAGAHDAHRPPHRHRHGGRPPHARPDVHPRGRRRAAPSPAPQRRARPRRGRDVPRRRPRPAPPALGRPRPATADRRRRPRAPAGRGRRRGAAPDARHRGRLGGRPRPARRRATSTAARAAGRRGADAAGPHRRRARRLRDAEAATRRRRPRRPAGAGVPRSWRSTRSGPTPCGSATATCSSTRPRTSTRCSTACSSRSSAAATTSTSSATRPRRSTASTAPIPGCSRDVAIADAGHRDHPPADQPPLHAPDRRRRHRRAAGRRPGQRRRVEPGRRTGRAHRRRRRRGPRGDARRHAGALPRPDGGALGDGRRAGPDERPGAPAVHLADRAPACRSCAASCRPAHRWPRSSRPSPHCRRRHGCGRGPTTCSRSIPGRASRPDPIEAAERRMAAAVLEFLRDQPFGDGAELRTWVASTNPFAEADDVVGVEVLTFHAAKGREWHTVVVTGVETGLDAAPLGDDRRGPGRGGPAAARRRHAGQRPARAHVVGASRRVQAPGQPADRRHRHRGGADGGAARRRCAPCRRPIAPRSTGSGRGASGWPGWR